MIDPRLLECASAAQIEENFRRLLAMIDALKKRVDPDAEIEDADKS